MMTQLLQVVFSFMGIMFIGPAILVASVFFLELDVGGLLARHGTASAVVFGLYGALVTFVFFALQDHFIVFKPEKPVPPAGKAELVRRITESFGKPVAGNTLFEVAEVDGKLIVTWSASLQYFQVVVGGGRAMKRVIVLTFDEDGHKVYFLMKDKDTAWRASLQGGEFSLNYATGLSAEFRTTVYPSVDWTPEGGLKVELKKLRYDSDELWLPIQKAVLSQGWSLHGGMVHGTKHRILFALPVGLLFLALGLGVAFLSRQQAAPEQRVDGPLPATVVNNLEANLAMALPSMKTDMIAVQIEGILSTPPQHLQDYSRRAFPSLVSAYIKRPDRREELVAEALAYAAREKISGVEMR